MRTALAIVCFSLSFVAFLIGVITEYRQSRVNGPVAIAPTLPWAVEGALFIVLGLFWLPTPIPWWAYILAFFSSVLAFGCLIGSATHSRQTWK